jgi:poly(A) polymerase
MNALFYDPDQQIVVDYVGGMKDIQKKQVKPVISLAEIFADDPVRMIRAVKYAAAAGFSLPVSLRWKIRKQSSLIALISPSRLTEEIFKIIHSDKASIIVDALDNMGLYIYLQPKAAKLMKESPGFRRRYLRSAAALNREGETPKHEALGALFNDYLQDIADWERGIAENYRLLYQAARAFIAPMNPPGFEMDRAVRNFFAAHGVTVKKSHFLEKPKPAHEPADAPEAAKKRQRRRRRGKKPSPPVQDGQE